ncbi:TetR/AcrR family transcriptional regulator, partial [Specibacter sp. RAF43]|uniref:TetR/AcrR family transcriptional regulator n=1 Tax=Specibacter sp. RAF43 TaxID=3233057 RepID=UPI003F9E033F
MTVDSAPSKREKNAVGRPRLEIDFNAVAEAAAAVFAENGYEGVSIDAVAEKLDISRATLYRTVPTKSHL